MSGPKRSLNMIWRQTWPIWLTFGVLIGFGVFGIMVLNPGRVSPTKALAPGEDLKLATGEVQQAEPRLFSIPLVSGQRAEFVIARGTNGDIFVTFASCRKCYRSGYYRQGDQIFCGRCDAPMERLAPGKAAASGSDCTPISIPFERSGDTVLIRASTVRDTFTRWYAPVISSNAQPPNPGQE